LVFEAANRLLSAVLGISCQQQADVFFRLFAEKKLCILPAKMT
jgi:hypothetical protein